MTPRPDLPLYDRRRWLLRLVGAADAGSDHTRESRADAHQAAEPAAGLSPEHGASSIAATAAPSAAPRPRNRAPSALPSVREDSE